MIYFSVTDPDAVFQELSAAGVTVTLPENTWHGARQVVLQDPDGSTLVFQRTAVTQ